MRIRFTGRWQELQVVQGEEEATAGAPAISIPDSNLEEHYNRAREPQGAGGEGLFNWKAGWFHCQSKNVAWRAFFAYFSGSASDSGAVGLLFWISDFPTPRTVLVKGWPLGSRSKSDIHFFCHWRVNECLFFWYPLKWVRYEGFTKGWINFKID